MRRIWLLGSVVVAAIGSYALIGPHVSRSADGKPSTLTVVSAPVIVSRTTPLPVPTPVTRTEGPKPDQARRAATKIASHDRRGGDVRMMATVIATQPRNAATAAPVEKAITAAFVRLPMFADAAQPLAVTCVRTACEITGRLPTGQTAATMQAALRDKELERAMLAQGYTAGSVVVADAGDGRPGFVAYLNNEF